MHARQLAELAGLAAIHAPALIKGRTLVGDSAMRQYWTAGRCRLDRWSSSIKKSASQLKRGPSPASSSALRATAEEILVCGILTRVWAAVARLYDEQHEVEQLAPVADSIFHGHLEARRQVLKLLADGPELAEEDAAALNRLRRRCERWTDMLVGYLFELGDVEEYVFDAQRAREFSEDLSCTKPLSGAPAAWALLSASLKAIFESEPSAASSCADLNKQIATAIMSCYPAEAFDGTGVSAGLWLSRLSSAAEDAQGMIDAFLCDAEAPLA
jgi:hypothetical protein